MQDQYVTISAAWFTLSLVNAGLAQAKQRSGLNWWFASLFIGPLATLLIVAWPPGGGSHEPTREVMSRWQAIGIGVVILVVIVGFAAFVQLTAGA